MSAENEAVYAAAVITCKHYIDLASLIAEQCRRMLTGTVLNMVLGSCLNMVRPLVEELARICKEHPELVDKQVCMFVLRQQPRQR